MICPTCDGTGQINAKTGHLGLVIAARRKELGMTQEQFAKAAGVHRATVANIECGRHVVEIKRVRQFAEALKLSIEELIP